MSKPLSFLQLLKAFFRAISTSIYPEKPGTPYGGLFLSHRREHTER